MRARVLALLVAPESRKWWTLFALTFSLFMIMLDNTVVNVALPSIQRDLAIGVSELEWVVNAYALTFAVLMLTGGKLADFLGRRRVFMAGLAIFAVASLVCGLAGSAAVLIAFRAAQGVGSALMLPATLSIISATFPPRQRGAALGTWAGVSAMALALGPLVGGLLAQHADWSWIFFINVPIGALGLVGSLLVVPESRDTSREQRLDLPGLLASGVGLLALTYALIEANSYGWTSTPILALLAVSALALALFVALERRARLPMLDLGLFRRGTFAGANLVAFMVSLAMFGVFFFLSLYVQSVLGYSAVKAGATFLPMTLLIVVVAPVAGRLSDRFGSRWLMAGGMSLVGVSLLLFAQLDRSSSFLDILPGLLVGGAGMASTMSPMTAAALSAVPMDKAGVGAGVLNTSRQVGGALGIALMGAIFASYVHVAPSHPGFAAQFVSGLHRAMLVAAAIAFAAGLVALLTVRRHGHPVPEPATP